MLHEIDPFLPALLVGEQPPEAGCGPAGALDDDGGRRLAKLAGVEPGVLYACTERHNLLNHCGEWTRHDEAATDAAWALVSSSPGRRILMLGARVAEAFARALPVDAAMIPRFAALRAVGVELVRLPTPSDELGDSRAAQTMGQIVRAEVDRYRRARDSWCSIGLRSAEDVVYHPTTGRFAGDKPDQTRTWQVDAACAHDPGFEGLTEDQRDGLLEYLVDAAGRVCRWGAGVPCYVGPHSLDVAARAGQLAAARGWDSNRILLAVNAGAIHDLHECLPAVGDVPGPLVRALQATSPAWRRIDELARRAVSDLYASPFAPDVSGWAAQLAEIVHLADMDCRAVERAVFFHDAPSWLGDRGQRLAELAAESLARKRWVGFYNYDPERLLRAIAGFAPANMPSTTLIPIDP